MHAAVEARIESEVTWPQVNCNFETLLTHLQIKMQMIFDSVKKTCTIP